MKQDIFDKIMGLPGLRRFYPMYKKHKQVLLYMLFGGCTTLVSIVSFALANAVVNELIANVISWVFAVTVAYLTNRVWVFASQAKGREIIKEAAAFYAGRLTTLGIEELLLFVCVTLLGWNSLLIKLCAQILVLVGNYLLSKFLIFRK